MRIHRTSVIVRILAKGWWHRTTGNKEAMSRVLYDGFISLGGVYVKFLQLLLLRSDLFENWPSVQQLGVYEDVATEPLDVRRVLAEELGRRTDELILDSDEPFSAGSFGQVYRATLDGQKVIIKVLRPTLTRYLPFDLRLLGAAARFIDWLKPDGMVSLRELFAIFRDTTLRETDYRQEAVLGQTLHKQYRGHPKLVIPRTHAEFCTERLIVQDFVGGVSAAQLLELRKQGKDANAFVRTALCSDLNEQMRMLGYELLYGIFAHEVTQGDPHPGNVKLLRDNKVGLIDFGIGASKPEDRATLLELVDEYRKFYAGNFDVRSFSTVLLRMFSSDLVSAIDTLGSFPGRRNVTPAILAELEDAVDATYASAGNRTRIESLLEQGGLTRAFAQVINRHNRFGLKLHHESPSVIRAAQMFMVLANSLDCRKDVLPQVYEDVATQVRAESLVDGSHHSQVEANRALEIVAVWLERISAKDPLLFRQLSTRMGGISV